jgi:hypothetical protein
MIDHTLDLTADIIDVRDIIARIEELENTEDGVVVAPHDVEYRALCAIMDDLKGYGGDEQWRGDWYPLTLIRDHHFTEYAQELAEEIGAVDADAKWPNNCIDWDQAARELQTDYSSVEIAHDGRWVSYFYR